MARYKIRDRAKGLALWVKYLAYKHEDPSSIPNNHKKFGTCWHSFVIPVLGKWRQEDSCSSLASQLNQIGKIQVPVKVPVSKNKLNSWRKNT